MDFLRGFLGTLLQIILVIASLFFLVGGFFTPWLFLGFIICVAAIGGVRYWLGRIVRIR